MRSVSAASAEIRQLAESYGIFTSYEDTDKRVQIASNDALLATLRALGICVESGADIVEAKRARWRQVWSQIVEPATVSTPSEPLRLRMRVHEQQRDALAKLRVEDESGTEWSFDCDLGSAEIRDRAVIDGRAALLLEVATEFTPVAGYYRATLDLGPNHACTRIIAAPKTIGTADATRRWGVFAPTYSLHSSARGFGCGDVHHLRTLLDDVRNRGGHYVGTLPLLAAYLDTPFEPSPYVPVSRLFWNEVFTDLQTLPGLDATPHARAMLTGDTFVREAAALTSMPLVDYRRQMAVKRPIIAAVAEAVAKAPPQAYERFLTEHPEALRYAQFRAAVEHRRRAWRAWPEADQELGTPDLGDPRVRYHLYAQWAMQLQLSSLRGPGYGLYLDMPVGVHPDGYDTWRYRTQFALGCSTGAPPDSFFSLGQDWGFPPLHPEAIRSDGYEYVARCFRHQMRYASVLRIDHVMWMHRLYFVPIGADARSGVYVRYRPDELYAVTCLEAQRAGCTVVGEDLGTVPPNVRSAMTEHGLHRMHVLQFEAPAKGRLRSLSRVSVASLNTHDMPPFAGFCRGLDIDERVRSNLLDEASASRERAHRLCVCNNLARVLCPGRPRFDTLEEVDIAELVAACSEFLASSEAALLLVNLEDLWLETQPQNRPGTGAEQPNWRRKFRLTLEQICDDPTLHDRLNRISRLRRPDGHEND